MNFKTLQNNRHLLLLECISGSNAYGTNIPGSDTDIKGVFALPQNDFYGLNQIEQVNDEKNDQVYYELRRFIQLLSKNNPNILELIATPSDCILYKNPIVDLLQPELFLSKLCKGTFAGYAQTQVRKARGLNKKILNPLPKERKSILDFCYVIQGAGSISLKKWLSQKGFQQEDCGLVNIAHMHSIYALFHQKDGDLKGISLKDTANDVLLSSVPKGSEVQVYMSFNKNGYSVYCKEYKAYWNWVEKRNDLRYQNTLDHGKNYDAKNMMHTFRLLDMALEIAKEKRVIVRRPNRQHLLDIRFGNFEYDELVKEADEKLKEIEVVYADSDLPDRPDLQKIEEVLIEMRKQVLKQI